MTNTPDDQVRETTVGGVLREAAEHAASTVALVEGGGDRRWDYSDLLAGAEQVARALLGRFPRASGSRSGRRTRRSGCSPSSVPRWRA